MSSNNFFEELQKLTASAFNTMAGSAKHVEEGFKHNMEAILRKMDFVKREELDLLREALTQALQKQKELEAQIKILEEKCNALSVSNNIEIEEDNHISS
ncbi:MAG: accessory factor UbiK family protein [Sphingobacteriia bacterium]|nr:accessory factor UbiK family protein [Sphingobacteriia bacterium]